MPKSLGERKIFLFDFLAAKGSGAGKKNVEDELIGGKITQSICMGGPQRPWKINKDEENSRRGSGLKIFSRWRGRKIF